MIQTTSLSRKIEIDENQGVFWEVVWSKNSELLHDMSTASLNGRTTPRQFDLEDQNPFVFIQFFKYWIILLGVLW